MLRFASRAAAASRSAAKLASQTCAVHCKLLGKLHETQHHAIQNGLALLLLHKSSMGSTQEQREVALHRQASRACAYMKHNHMANLCIVYASRNCGVTTSE